MKTKRTTKIYILCLTVILLLAPLCLAFIAVCLPPVYGDTFLGEMKHKIELLKNTEGKRIVAIGGSATAFGFDGELIERCLPDYKFVNFGMYASMGTKIMLDIAEKHIRDGDIIVLSPEQNAQTLSLYFNSQDYWQCADGYFTMYKYLKSGERERVFGAFPEFAMTKLRCNITGVALQPTDIYRRESFDRYGDIKSGLREHNIMLGGCDALNAVSLSTDIVSPDFIDYINEFHKKVRARNASLYYRLPPMNAAATSGDANAFYDGLDAKIAFSILGDPNDSVMDCEWFYDTNYHLNDSGVIVNTYNFIRAIKTESGDPSPVDITLPDKPELPQAVGSGDNSCRDMFTYEITGDGAVITGMTAKGMSAESAIVPYDYDGKPVTHFTRGVFANNKRIKSLTLQNNIRMIDDRSFDGCDALEKIILVNTEPNTVAIGENPLYGTSANIYVPESAYATYITNYSWSALAKRIRKYG